MFSMTDDRWRNLESGVGCPFCAARPEESADWSKVAGLAVSTLYLGKVQTYRGYALLVFDPRHATRLGELAPVEREAFWSDVCRAQSAIERVTKPQHMNIASLGNQVPHLHWHIIPRYANDSRWGAPIWTTTQEEMEVVRLPDEEHRSLVEAIRGELV